MSVIAEGFNIGNINLSSKYCMTQAQIDAIGEGEGYPDVFPIWNVDNEKLYIFYRTTEGVPNICRIDEVPGSIEVPVLYPTIDPETNILTWEIRELTSEVPDPVTLMGGQDGKDGEDGAPGANGKSAYEIWLELGNEGTEDDFIDSLKGEKGDTGDATDISSWTDAQVRQLKERMGIPEILDAIDNLQLLIANLTERVKIIEDQISPIDPGEDSDDDNPGDDSGSGDDTDPTGGDNSGSGDDSGSDDSGSGDNTTDPINGDDSGDATDDTTGEDDSGSDNNSSSTEESGDDNVDSTTNEDNTDTNSTDDNSNDSDNGISDASGDNTGDFGDEDTEESGV